ncbi:MAG: Na+/H+ antiporter subunit E [Geminicoccaceae bacterium]|nr:Na+/H+ antiporter subunit E [Geminicoccaceae bacterium]
MIVFLHAVSLTFALSVLWILLSGYLDHALLLYLGAVSVVLCVVISWRMGLLDREGHPVELVFRGLLYWPWLGKEIVLANIDVAKAIIGWGGAAPDPTMFDVRASQKTAVGLVTYANSITLTPGTVTVAAEGDRLTIHALTSGAVEGLAGGEMDRRVRWFEGTRISDGRIPEGGA